VRFVFFAFLGLDVLILMMASMCSGCADDVHSVRREAELLVPADVAVLAVDVDVCSILALPDCVIAYYLDDAAADARPGAQRLDAAFRSRGWARANYEDSDANRVWATYEHERFGQARIFVHSFAYQQACLSDGEQCPSYVAFGFK